MSITKALQDYLAEYDGIDIVLTDIPGEFPASYAIEPAGSQLIGRDIFGNRAYQNSYIFLAKEHVADEVNRQENYSFLEAFSDWIDEQSAVNNLPTLPRGCTPKALEVSNILLIGTEDGGTGLYQVQIQLIFIKGAKNKWLT